jgi:S-adenosylmethionine hydrolase
MTRPLVTLLTDFGVRDPSAAICRGVIFRIAPGAEVLDLTHEVRKFAIRDGALMLWSALPYLPVGFHVAVVDPGVGTSRRPIAVRMGRGDILVGPDNGLLLGPADRLGGVDVAIELVAPEYRLPVVSTSFHGRDIFAPAAAHLAAGVPLEALGPWLDPATLVPSPLPAPRSIAGGLATEIVYVDTFGNVKLSALATDLVAAFGPPGPGAVFDIGPAGGDGDGMRRLPWAATFGEVGPGQPLLYEDSYGRVCLGVNQGNAAERLGLVTGMELELRPV